MIKTIIATLLVSAVTSFAFASSGTMSKFKITFKSNWSKTTHPVSFPANPHFSPITGALHNADYSLFLSGDKATKGLEQVAETGNNTQLNKELRVAENNGEVGTIINGPGLGSSPGSATFTIIPDTSYPLLSLVTMIAPSPDWIVGVRNVSLIENGEFIKKKEIPLFAYDAGTDGGKSYTAADFAMQNSAPVSLLNKGEIFIQNKTLVPFGTMTIELVK